MLRTGRESNTNQADRNGSARSFPLARFRSADGGAGACGATGAVPPPVKRPQTGRRGSSGGAAASRTGPRRAKGKDREWVHIRPHPRSAGVASSSRAQHAPAARQNGAGVTAPSRGSIKRSVVKPLEGRVPPRPLCERVERLCERATCGNSRSFGPQQYRCREVPAVV
jgi:hypothetical protein